MSYCIFTSKNDKIPTFYTCFFRRDSATRKARLLSKKHNFKVTVSHKGCVIITYVNGIKICPNK